MWLADDWKDYEIIDCSGGEKLERWKDIILRRPDPLALWPIAREEGLWVHPHARYHRSAKGGGHWEYLRSFPESWSVHYGKLRFKVSPTGFKHTGLFPEQAANWDFMMERIRNAGRPVRVLNLFAYTGGATLAAGSAGASVTHVDSVKPVVSWARENMEASGLDGVRWIVDDALKFARREVKRGRKYSGIILDPPAYGRGPDGEKWILEENLNELLRLCGELLDPEHGFLVLNLYSMGLSALLARTAVRQLVGDFTGEQFGELYFNDSFGKALPLGVYYRCWRG